jgi:hypothetical protein
MIDCREEMLLLDQTDEVGLYSLPEARHQAERFHLYLCRGECAEFSADIHFGRLAEIEFFTSGATMTLFFSRQRLSLLFLFLLFLLTACSFGPSTPPPPTPLGAGIESPLLAELLGKWQLAHGSRFGNAILEFQENGTLIVENTDDQSTKTLQYIFVQENTLALAGDLKLAGTATIKIDKDEMEFTMIFADQVFGDIFPRLTRVK